MGNTLMSLLVKIGGDTAELQDALGKAESMANKSSGSIVDGLSKIGSTLVLGGLAAAGAGVVALGGFLAKSVMAASDAEDKQAQLASVIAQTGKTTGVTVKQINDLSTALSKTTKFEDDAVSAAGGVLARFDKIGKDTMPMAMQATVDLAQSMGIDLSSAATMVGKALQTPGEGLLRLKAAGVSFTDEETKLIQSLEESGNTAMAQQVILASLSGTMGGAAQAAGQTLSGKMEILKNSFGNVMETVGGALLPVLTNLATMMSDKLADPAVQAWINNVAAGIALFASNVVSYIPQVIQWFQQISGWFTNNQGVIVGILAALGVAIAAFVYTTVIPAAIAAVTAMAPIIAVLALVGAAAYLLYQAWITDFGGIQEKAAAVWAWLQPIFAQIQAWLAVNIPIAITTLKGFWENTLLPAIKSVWNWMQTVLFPTLQTLWNWLSVNVPAAIQTVSGWINNTLIPAWNGVSKAIQGIIGWIGDMIKKLESIKLPDWLTPGSPTPFEMGLRGIGSALADLSTAKLPAFQAELSMGGNMPVGGGSSSVSTSEIYYINDPITGKMIMEQARQKKLDEISGRV